MEVQRRQESEAAELNTGKTGNSLLMPQSIVDANESNFGWEKLKTSKKRDHE